MVSMSYKGQYVPEGGAKMSTVIKVITYTSVLHSIFFPALYCTCSVMMSSYAKPFFRKITRVRRIIKEFALQT